MEMLKAPKGKFRVVGVDTFAHEDWIVGDFADEKTAIETAKAKGGVMTKMHVYDDRGHHLAQAGSF